MPRIEVTSRTGNSETFLPDPDWLQRWLIRIAPPAKQTPLRSLWWSTLKCTLTQGQILTMHRTMAKIDRAG